LECAGSWVKQPAVLLQVEESYDLCLTDMRLPDGDGWIWCGSSEPQLVDLPVAGDTRPVRSAPRTGGALKAGAFDYLNQAPVAGSAAGAGEIGAFRFRRNPPQQVGETQLLGASRGIEQVRSVIEKARAQPGACLHHRRIGQRQGSSRLA